MATLVGTADDDILVGTDGADVLRGLSGDDILDGGKGADALYGAGGNDLYVVDDAGDTVQESGDGEDTVKTKLLAFLLPSKVEKLTAIGSGNRLFTGNELDNVIAGSKGDDVLQGGAGDDVLVGRGGNDVFDGGDGFDRAVLNFGRAGGGLYYENGYLEIGRQFVSLEFRNIEALTISGTTFRDDIRVGGSDWIVKGGGGADYISDDGGSNALYGGDGDDLVHDTGGVDVLDGGRGRNFLELYRWGVSIDLALVFNPAPGKLNRLQDGTTFRNFSGLYLETGSGNDRLDGHLSDRQIWLHGHGGDDVLIGGNAGDYLLGYEGDDVLEGGRGNDDLGGGAGNDVLSGGAGDDTLDGAAGADVLTGGDGNDRLSAGSGSRVDGGAGFDLLRLDLIGSTKPIDITDRFVDGIVYALADGTSFTNVEALGSLRATPGDDRIEVTRLAGGYQEILGGRGIDRAVIDLSTATVPVVVRSFRTVAGPRLEMQVGPDLLVVGDMEYHTIIGGAAADRITGGGRADQLTGGGGNDVFAFGPKSSGDAILDFADGQDRIDVSGFGYRSLADLSAAGGGFSGLSDTLITFNSTGDSVRLANVQPGSLTAADFLFAP